MSDISTQDVDAFLEHHGIKGQRWGIRKLFKKGQRGDFRSRSGKQRLALIGGGAAGLLVGGAIAKAIINLTGEKTLGAVAGAGVSTITTIAGVRATRAFLDRHGSKKVSSLGSKKHTNKQAIEKAEGFLKKRRGGSILKFIE